MEVLNSQGDIPAAEDDNDEDEASRKVAGEAIEISDDEAPDMDEAKRNLRILAEQKRKAKKTKVQGVTQDMQVEGDAEITKNAQPAARTDDLPEILPPNAAAADQPQNTMMESAALAAPVHD